MAVWLAFPAAAIDRDIVGVVRVIDADTFDVGGRRIRLHAIDAPERGQPCQTEHGVTWAGCGDWVSKVVTDTYGGAQARCLPLDRDRYGRTVARCYVEGRDIGGDLVTRGLVFAYAKYGSDYVAHQAGAAAQDRGLHALRVTRPGWYRQTRAQGRIPPDTNCRIKGNISQNGKIFHKPGQYFYERTGVNPDKGERWFCNEADALVAGWRPAKR